MESTAPVVREPDLDRPAIADPTTAILLRVRQDQHVGLAAVVVLVAFLLFSSVLFSWLGDSPLLWVHAVAMVTVLSLIGSRWYLWGRWLRRERGPSLLHTRPWRAVPAVVARSGARSGATTVVVEENGSSTAIRVTALSRAHRAVIARTGRAWVVGPDEAGWAALRVDGTHEALPAKTLKAVPATKVKPETGDPAALHARELRLNAVYLVASLLPGVAVAFAGYLLVGNSTPKALLFTLFLLVLLCGIQSAVLWASRANLALPRLVATAEWTRVELSLAPWRSRRDGSAKATATVRLPDGTTRTLVMVAAPVELLGTIWDTGAAWLSATPEPGAKLAIGHPGYPPVAAARVA